MHAVKSQEIFSLGFETFTVRLLAAINSSMSGENEDNFQY